MRSALRFTKGAVKENGTSPEMAYYQISGGRITSFNGVIALSSPIDVNFDVAPRAEVFHNTIQSCGEDVTMTLSDNGVLHVKSGGFSAHVPCLSQALGHQAAPEGDKFPLPGGFTNACRQLLPIIPKNSIAAAWASVIQAENGCLTVTNNAVVIQSWVGFQTPAFDIIREAAIEVVRLGEDPTHVQVADASVTFHYSDGRWLRAQRSVVPWPSSSVNLMLDAVSPNEMVAVPFKLFDVLELITPFMPANNAAVYFGDGKLSTSDNLTRAEGVVEGLFAGPIFNGRNLFLLRDFAEEIDFAAYPSPSRFRGANCRGLIVGLSA